MSDSESDNENHKLNLGVELGFLMSTPSWKLESRFFPSKVGSKPAWLALSKDIPNSSDLICSSCNKTLIFLCQIYAPVEPKEYCFHRTLYVFVCKTDNCIKSNCNTGFKVYRSQLPRFNKYYPSEPPVEEEMWRTDIRAESFNVKLCHVCGIRSKNHCGKCKTIYYCSKEHQVHDWKSGHKNVCNNNDKHYKGSETMMFSEREIVTEPESDVIEESKESDDKSNDTTAHSLHKGSLQDVNCVDDLLNLAYSDEDKNFFKFREKIKYAPEQVVRYERKGVPLWMTDSNVPLLQDVQNCQYCGGKRIYEFQVLPQLLNYLGLDVSRNSLDWGTLVIFTCEKSCDEGPDYKLEYLLKHDIIFSGK